MTEKLVHINTINNIVSMAEDAIFERTGRRVQLLIMADNRDPNINWRGLMRVVANAIGMVETDYLERTRVKDYLHLRYLAAMFLKQYFPDIKWFEMKELLNYGDHTDPMRAVERAEKLLQLEDYDFVDKHNRALQAVTQWANREHK